MAFKLVKIFNGRVGASVTLIPQVVFFTYELGNLGKREHKPCFSYRLCPIKYFDQIKCARSKSLRGDVWLKKGSMFFS